MIDGKHRKALLIILIAVVMVIVRIFLYSKGIISINPYAPNILKRTYIITYVIASIIAWLASIYLFVSWIRWFINTEDKVSIKGLLYLCFIIILVVGFTYFSHTDSFRSDLMTSLGQYQYKVGNFKVQ